MQCKLKAVVSWNEIGEIWISSFIVELRHYLLTSTAVASNPESSEEQILTTGCLSTWQFNLYNKSYGDLSEIQRMRLPKLHSLSFAYLSIPQTACNWRHNLIWHPLLHPLLQITQHFLLLFFGYKQLPGCTVANT